jgi:transcriptional regulator with XRE-family HTH domain
MASTPHHRLSGEPEPIGALLARLRRTRGWSQHRLAEKLNETSGMPTVTRHEVSRWEREQRLPASFWLGWLAVTLAAPLDDLESTLAATRRRRNPDTVHVEPPNLWRRPTAEDLLTALDHADPHDVRELAHAWLAGPPGPSYLHPPDHDPAPPAGRALPLDGGTARDTLAALDARLARLRRMDDQLGGLDLAGLVDRALREAVSALRTLSAGGLRPRAMRTVAGYAQLSGWTHADAGNGPAARRAFRVGLHAATAAGDRGLAAHVLGALSHHTLAAGDPREALLLAQTAHTGVRSAGSPLTRALLLHRVALAAAHAGERRAAETALCQAERLGERSTPERVPDWLYWLDAGERAAMTGRCLAALGRPLRAVRLLPAHAGTGPRAAALYATWLARSYLALGEVERACWVAMSAHVKVAAAGSVRATAALRHLHALLLRHRDVPSVRRYERFAAATAAHRT